MWHFSGPPQRVWGGPCLFAWISWHYRCGAGQQARRLRRGLSRLSYPKSRCMGALKSAATDHLGLEPAPCCYDASGPFRCPGESNQSMPATSNNAGTSPTRWPISCPSEMDCAAMMPACTMLDQMVNQIRPKPSRYSACAYHAKSTRRSHRTAWTTVSSSAISSGSSVGAHSRSSIRCRLRAALLPSGEAAR